MQNRSGLTRREWLSRSAGAAALSGQVLRSAPSAPVSPVAIAKCPTYDEDLVARLGKMFDQIGGMGKLVSGKTVTIKLNLTGSPSNRYPGYSPNVTHWVHPKLVGATCHLLGRAGAKRIRLVESCGRPLDVFEDFIMDAGWDVKAIQTAAPLVEFENTNTLGKGKRYSRLKVPHGGYIFPAFDLNHSYEDTDVFMSMSKLKNHANAGITLSIKNCFGTTPTAVYGDDSGVDEPNEKPRGGRGSVLHQGKRQPPKSAPQELSTTTPRQDGYRLPRIIVDIIAARPIDLNIIDGIESAVGGEGPWIRGSKYTHPGVLVVGRNPVCTDSVATAIMGYDPQATRDQIPFVNCDNTMKLAEAVGLGSADLKKIEVVGVPVRDAVYDFESRWKGNTPA